MLPFWLKNSRDERCGGYFDYLAATGEPIDGDKFISAQAQQTATFAWLYNHFDRQPAFLTHARHGGIFLRQFAQDARQTCYAEVDRLGQPISPAVDSLPACSVTMAYAELQRATGEGDWAELAMQTFDALGKQRVANWERQQEIGGFRQVRHLGEAVAFLQTALTMRPLLDAEQANASLETAKQDILHEFLDRRTDTLRELILPGGAFLNTPDGRRQNVGLTFGAISALLDLCAEAESNKTGGGRASNRKLTAQVTAWALRLCEQAWDETAGGLIQYIDQKKQPIVFVGFDQKWHWVQLEAANALAKSYRQTQQPACLTWLQRIHEHSFQHFPDVKYGAWHIALDQTNQPLTSAKVLPAANSALCLRAMAETAKVLAASAEPVVSKRGRPIIPSDAGQ